MADDDLTEEEIAEKAKEYGDLLPLLQEIAEEDGYPPTERDLHEMVDMVKIFVTREDRSLADWSACRLAFRLYGDRAKDEILRLHNGRFGLVEEEEIREDFRAKHGEERGFVWKAPT